MLGQVHDPDLHLLRLFVTVVEAGGFSAAQGVLGLSQPTISQRMAQLETRLGYRLCSRGKGGFHLTEKGTLLLDAARGLLLNIEQFRQQANGVGERLLGTVRIGMAENQDKAVSLKLAQAIAAFRTRKESVQLELISAPPAELERLLLEQRLDYAISYFSGIQAAFDYQPLFQERQRLYCGKGHELFGEPSVGLERLLEMDQVRHPYRFLKGGEPFQSRHSMAVGGADRERADVHAVRAAYWLPALPLRARLGGGGVVVGAEPRAGFCSAVYPGQASGASDG